jgi:hypothetical protein
MDNRGKVLSKYPDASVYVFSPAVWNPDAFYDTVWIEDGHDNKLSDHFFHSDTAWDDAAKRLESE